jgi:NADH-quinone oxidoreductase subunit F
VTDVLTPVLTEHWDDERSWTLRSYERSGGYASVDKALGMSPDDVVSLVKDSGLRGRGGAGFSTGMKWGFIPKAKEGEVAKPHYLVVNADESEPGTCKDIPLMMASPHTLVEGVIVSSYAIRANVAFIYVRGEVLHVVRRLQRAVQEAYLAGHLGKDIHGSGYDLDLIVHAGAGAYICGEETALLDSLEGRRGQPRLRPPFPAVAGLYASPTVINNVESIASVPCIVNGGASWFASMGTEKSKGMTLYSLSGHVKRPGQFEAPLGITLRELLDLSGGVREGHTLKFWTPGGSSTPILTDEHLDVPLDYEGVAAAGSMLGTRALQIFDETTCVVRAVLRWTEFYKHESCGKCTPVPRGHVVAGPDPGPAREGRGQRGRPRPAARPVRQHPGPLLLRPGRRRDQPDLELDQVLPRRVPRPPEPRRLPVRPGRLDRLPPDDHLSRGSPRMTATDKAPDKVDTGLVTLTIDGVQVSVPKDTLVIRAAEQVGIEIPRFCDHPLLEPVGACRQCLVEIPDAGNGRPIPKPQASCTLPVADGMVVKTQVSSPVADKAQQGIIEFLLINHPLDCPVCDKGGECPLQNQAMSHGAGESRFTETKRTFPKPINVSAQVLLDRERCVLCARCTRFSEQVAGDPFIALLERGALQQVGIYEHAPFCPTSRQHHPDLPVGALTSAEYRFRSAPSTSSPRPAWRSTTQAVRRSRRPPTRARSCVASPATTPRSTRSGSATRTASPSTTPASRPPGRTRWSATRTASCGPRSWTEAFAVAARGLRAAGSALCSPVGDVSAEDAYASRSLLASPSAPTTSTSRGGRTALRRPTSSPPSSR